ncbi:MAG: PD-(D/E)XK nuclease family protein [Bifidobacterium sp.]|jgi:superfamily I DNA/RNA helicase|nr:PD-(D/E)XK nuclease family protein [Bifidobacterium sp.]
MSGALNGGCDSPEPGGDMDAVNLREIRDLIGGDRATVQGSPAPALLVSGPPCSGKTLFATRALLEGVREFGDSGAVMAVSNRQAADEASDRIIHALKVTSQARPVATLPAIAFRIIESVRSREGMPAPKLLNGAEQDAVLRRVLARHIHHARSGDLCPTCMMLRGYFAVDDWSSLVSSDPAHRTGGLPATSEELFTRGINDSFVMQLRDILARTNELGIGPDQEQGIVDSVGMATHQALRRRTQWGLAFALRREYHQAVAEDYPDEFRLDSSRLLVEGSLAAARARDGELPRCVIVDDFQDLTLAGLSFLESMHVQGSRMVLVGNPDEAVQVFRGSYPEFLFRRAQEGVMAAHAVSLDAGGHVSGERIPERAEPASYRDLVASRISLSIACDEPTAVPMPQRPGKLPPVRGSFPTTPLSADDPLMQDGSVDAALYHSGAEEVDDIVWRIKRRHLQGSPWNDLALIAHDNATVRLFGERLRRDGVPVRYSSVTRPLSEEPFVRGLFALIELARLRNRGLDRGDGGQAGMGLEQAAAYVRSRVHTLMGSSLIAAYSNDAGRDSPPSVASVESAMGALESLAHVIGPDGHAPLNELVGQWDAFIARRGGESADGAIRSGSTVNGQTGIVHEQTDVGGQTGVVRERADGGVPGGDRSPAFGIDALYLMLAENAECTTDTGDSRFTTGSAPNPVSAPVSLSAPVPTPASDAGPAEGERPGGRTSRRTQDHDGPDTMGERVRDAIKEVNGADPNVRAFAHLWDLVGTVARGMATLGSDQPQYVLSLAWQSCGVAEKWQRTALRNTADGRAANDRLDAAMRLFTYAQSAASSSHIAEFIEQVRSLRIEADSLAKVAPIDQAVTLSTPAGSAGHHWPFVWIAALQQGVWPNLAERNAMFGGEDLARIMMHGRAGGDVGETSAAGGSSTQTVLHAEEKSLLVAFTRGDRHVSLSAVFNEDAAPSDFLYSYVPELYDRDSHTDPDTRQYTPVGGDDPFAGLDTDVRGLVAAARIVLAREPADGDRASDAAQALALLARRGVREADPRNWAFADAFRTGVEEERRDDDADNAGHAAKTDDAAGGGNVPGADPDGGSAPVVLSPSAVDQLWACPVCWLLENRFAGPRGGSAGTSFGTIIHRVAQEAGDAGLDLPSFMASRTPDERLAEIRSRMIDIYEGLHVGIDDGWTPSETYKALRNEGIADDVIGTIASYFVHSNDVDYPTRNVEKFEVGTLDQSRCEVEFSSTLTFDRILGAYNAMEGVDAVTRHELFCIMRSLVPEWPEAMSEDIVIRLSGRIDREEIRTLPDGSSRIRLVDYKTGRVPPIRQIVNDLQLVCYQLGLDFPQDGGDPAVPGTGMPLIAQSVLFHVSEKNAPAESYGAEGLFQPPLMVDGHLNDSVFTARYHYSSMAALLDAPVLPEDAPEGVDPHAWGQFLALRGTQAVWALTMISRVFYAAAASRSAHLIAHPQPSHLRYCRMTAACPACAGHSDTVFEVRQA